MKKLLAVLATLSVTQLHAAEVKLSGYATIRAGWLDSEYHNPFLPKFYDELHTIDLVPESFVGLQANLDINEKWDSVVQINSEAAEDFDINVTWAYVGYKINEVHYLRVGRFAMPIFHHSSYERVGYAHNYSRLPKSVYYGFEFNTLDGVSLDSKWIVNTDLFIKTKLIYGRWRGDMYESVTNSEFGAEFKDLFSFNLEVYYGNLKLFTGYFFADMESKALEQMIDQQLEPAIRLSEASDAEANRALDNLYFNGMAHYGFVGFTYDINGFEFSGELTNFGASNSIDQFNANWYISAGYSITDTTTVTIHQERFNQLNSSYPQLDGVTNPILQEAIRQGVDNFASREMDLTSINIRYDFHTNMAFKFDYTWGKDARSNVGKIQFASIGVDFVF